MEHLIGGLALEDHPVRYALGAILDAKDQCELNPIGVKSSGSSPELATYSGAETTQRRRNLLFKLLRRLIFLEKQ